MNVRNDIWTLSRAAMVPALLLLGAGCGNLTQPRLDPGGQIIDQNVTFAPMTSAASPAMVSRSGGLPATISAALATHAVSVSTSGGNCVTEQIAGGFVPGATAYSFTFVALAGATPACSELVAVDVDGTRVPFYVIVP